MRPVHGPTRPAQHTAPSAWSTTRQKSALPWVAAQRPTKITISSPVSLGRVADSVT
jgi:hypothetical protein